MPPRGYHPTTAVPVRDACSSAYWQRGLQGFKGSSTQQQNRAVVHIVVSQLVQVVKESCTAVCSVLPGSTYLRADLHILLLEYAVCTAAVPLQMTRPSGVAIARNIHILEYLLVTQPLQAVELPLSFPLTRHGASTTTEQHRVQLRLSGARATCVQLQFNRAHRVGGWCRFRDK